MIPRPAGVMRCPARGLHLPEQSKCWHSPCRKRDGLNAAGLLSGMPHPWRKDGSFRESETAKSHRCSPSPGSEKGQLRLSFNAVLHKGLRTSQPHPMPQAEPCCSPASSGSCPASAAQRGEQEPPCSKQKGSTWIIGVPENRAPPQCTFQPNQALSIAFCCQTPGLNQPN